jgi:hypothetical protein
VPAEGDRALSSRPRAVVSLDRRPLDLGTSAPLRAETLGEQTTVVIDQKVGPVSERQRGHALGRFRSSSPLGDSRARASIPHSAQWTPPISGTRFRACSPSEQGHAHFEVRVGGITSRTPVGNVATSSKHHILYGRTWACQSLSRSIERATPKSYDLCVLRLPDAHPGPAPRWAMPVVGAARGLPPKERAWTPAYRPQLRTEWQ